MLPQGALSKAKRDRLRAELEAGAIKKLYWVYKKPAQLGDVDDVVIGTFTENHTAFIDSTSVWFFDNYFFAWSCVQRRKARLSETG